MPGLVEGHSHAAEGTFWRYTYLGRFDRMDPEGKVWPGAESIEDVVTRLQQVERKLASPTEVLAAGASTPSTTATVVSCAQISTAYRRHARSA